MMIEFLTLMLTIEAALIVFLARHLRILASDFNQFRYDTKREVINLTQQQKDLDAGLCVQAQRLDKVYDSF